MYADPGDTIVVIGDDPILAGVAGAAGCHYRQVDRLADLAALHHLGSRAGNRVGILITSWPRPQPGRLPGDAALLFAAGEHLVDQHGSTIVTLPIRPTEDSYGDHGWRLLTEAHDAGFKLRAHLVVIDDPATTSDGPTQPAAAPGAARLLQPYRHVLIFVPPEPAPHRSTPRAVARRAGAPRRRRGR
ncbi:hypothetical protein Daura_23185 [Dactylosporangium aurantiacum]|uniref:Uncharacterized protein n=1 Tax=Dactylosporangium aurantiacum TaxID=35754 RepID=A0A9Q9ISY1_9ACTN|nr:hypothetical protein [Dactylosporangium aurantiacum]MDG6104009.1 hypothetical protein [Dactylosporangium aurantiacum]UWZ58815.1 hypothetical protein Daura_23185 [Dactylosporangium aurantiacum]